MSREGVNDHQQKEMPITMSQKSVSDYAGKKANNHERKGSKPLRIVCTVSGQPLRLCSAR